METPKTLVVRVQSGVAKSRIASDPWRDLVDSTTELIDIGSSDVAVLHGALQSFTGSVVVFCEDRLTMSRETFDVLIEGAMRAGFAGAWSPNIGGQLRLEDRPKSARADQLTAYLGRATRLAPHELNDVMVDPAVFAVAYQQLRSLDFVDVRYGHISMALGDLAVRLQKANVSAIAPAGAVAVGTERDEVESLAWLLARRTDWLRYLRLHGDAPARVNIKTAKASVSLGVSMIVKDESSHIAQALRSIAGIADEVVVYDTGSTDDTREIARAAGATVIEGYWDDDFARARNASVDACTTDWVIFVDADDVICADEATFLAQLRSVSREFDVLLFACNNFEGHHVAPIINSQSWDSPRVFRRKRAQFRDRIHEQLVPRDGQRDLNGARIESIRLLHTGYITEVIKERGKLDRNARIGGQEVGDPSLSPGSREYGLARASLGSGDIEGALSHLAKSVQLAESSKVQRLALREGIDIFTQNNRIPEAREWLEQLGRCDPDPAVMSFLTGLVLVNEKQYDAAIALLEPLGEAVQDGASYSAGAVAEVRAKAKMIQGDYAGAADDFLKGVIADPSRAGLWEYALQLWKDQGRDWNELARAVPLEFAVAVANEINHSDAANLESWLNAMWQVYGEDARLLALALSYGKLFTPERALEWSARLMAVGTDQRLPIMEVANNVNREPTDRMRAAMYAFAATGDPAAQEAIEQIAGLIPLTLIGPIFDEVCELAPEMAETYVLGCATDSHRCEILAEELDKRDNADVASEIRAHGESLRVHA